jgi:hypothetical protein
MPTPADDIEQIKNDTAKLLGGLNLDEVSYITPDLLALPVKELKDLGSDELPAHEEHQESDTSRASLAGIVPNRIMFISEIQGGFVPGGLSNIIFFANCDRRARYLMWSNQYSRWERDGTCGVGGGRYVPLQNVVSRIAG